MLRELGWIVPIVSAVVALVVGAFIGFYFRQGKISRKLEAQEIKAETVLLQATEKAREIELEAKDAALKITRQAESDIAHKRSELNKEDDRLVRRREELDRRFDQMQQREATMNKRQSSIDRRANEIEGIYSQRLEELQRVSQMTTEEARQVLLAEVEKEARADMSRIIRQIEAEARETGNVKARELIADAIQRVASDKVAEVTTSLVILPNEEMKGRIVGRNGRNIRAFEQAAGVDVIVDDTLKR